MTAVAFRPHVSGRRWRAFPQLVSFFGLLAAMAATGAGAQLAVPERKGIEAIQQEARIREALRGTRIGSFRLLPALVVSSGYDSNIYATQSDREGDHVTMVSPSVRLRSGWQEHALNLTAGADISRYASNDAEDTEEYDVSADGRFDLTERAYLFGGAGHSLEHEDRTSPDDVLGEEPTPYHLTQAHLGLGREGSRFSVQGGATFERVNYDDVPFTLVPATTQPGHGFGRQLPVTGEINNDDRDRDVMEYGVRIGAKLGSVWEAFVQASVNERDYVADADDFGFQRDSSGRSGGAGLSWQLGKRLQGEVLAGYLTQDYDDGALEDVSTVDFGGRLNWRASGRTRITAYLDRSLEETTQPGASGYLYTLGGARVGHAVSGSFEVGAGVSYGQADFQGVARTDDLIGVGGFLKVFLYRQVYLQPDFQYSERMSELEGADYTRNQYFLRLGIDL